MALWSYSIYLSHKAVAHIVMQCLSPVAPDSAWLLLAITMASLGVGWTLYRGVEVHFMALRQRWAPTNFPVTTSAAPIPAIPSA